MKRNGNIFGAVAEYREELKQTMCQAYQRGFSLLEIVRITGARNPAYAYNVLRDEHMFPSLPRGKPRQVKLDKEIKSAFSKVSLARWANMWRFAPERVAEVLSADPEGCGLSQEIHSAFQRDFPDLYQKLYPNSVLNFRNTVRFKTGLVPALESLDVLIRYDEALKRYTATAISVPDLEGYGQSWVQAVTDLEKLFWIYKAITRLKFAIEAKL